MHKSARWILSAGLFTFVSVVYLSTLSQDYVYDFAAWYWPAIEAHPLTDPWLWYPNHLLHLPLEYIVYRAWQSLGYQGSAIIPTQVVSALAGAAVVVFLFLTVLDILNDHVTALAVAVGAAFARSLWVFSTDAWYYPLYLMGATVATWLMVPVLKDTGPIPRDRVFLAGLVLGFTVLVAQLTVLVIPAMIVALLVATGFRTRVERWQSILLFSAVALLPIAAGYLLVGIGIYGYRSPSEFLAFGTSHTVLPQWGSWALDRFVRSVPYFLGSFVPLMEGMGLRALLQGNLRQVKLVPFISLVCLLSFLVVLIVYALTHIKRLFQTGNAVIAFSLAWIVPVWIFLTWYEPQAMAGCMLVTPVWLLIALVLGDAFRNQALPWRRWAVAGTWFVVLIVAIGTFVSAINPRHTQPNAGVVKAQVAGQHLDEGDILIGVRWDWTLYVPYFGKRDGYNLASRAAGQWTADEIRQELCGLVARQLTAGKRAFMADTGHYTANDWDWLLSPRAAGLKFTPDDFAGLARRHAWAFEDGEIVWELLPCRE